MLNGQLLPATQNRPGRSHILRDQISGIDAFVLPPNQIDNGDEALYADKSGTYTKGLLQNAIGIVNQAAYQAFKAALASGDPRDFEKIIPGGARTQNGPQAGLAHYLDCVDSSQIAVPPAPALASEEVATVCG